MGRGLRPGTPIRPHPVTDSPEFEANLTLPRVCLRLPQNSRPKWLYGCPRIRGQNGNTAHALILEIREGRHAARILGQREGVSLGESWVGLDCRIRPQATGRRLQEAKRLRGQATLRAEFL